MTIMHLKNVSSNTSQGIPKCLYDRFNLYITFKYNSYRNLSLHIFMLAQNKTVLSWKLERACHGETVRESSITRDDALCLNSSREKVRSYGENEDHISLFCLLILFAVLL